MLTVCAVGLGLSFYQLSGNGLWIDEFSSLEDALAFPAEVHPIRPVYYIVLRGWMLLGTGEIWLRSLSVICAVGAIALLYDLGRRIADRWIGTVAAFLMAVSPLWLNHVQEVRMYPLGSLLTLGGSVMLLRSLYRTVPEAPRPFGSIAGWAVLRLLGTLTIPLSILLLPADGLIVIDRFRGKWRQWLPYVVAVGLVGLCLVPSAYVMVTSAAPDFFSDWAAAVPKPGIASIISKLTSFTVFWPLAEMPGNIVSKALYYGMTLLWAVLLALALKQTARWQTYRWVALWIFVPAAIMLLVSYLFNPIWSGRYLLFLAPYVMILLAVGLSWVWQRSRPAFLTLAVVYAIALIGGWGQYYGNWSKDGWREATAYVAAERGAGDAIAVYAPLRNPSLAVTYYLNSENIEAADGTFYDLGPFEGAVSAEAVDQVLDAIPQERDHLWIVFRNFNGIKDANRLVAEGINARYEILSEEKFAGPITVYEIAAPA